jgi:hypothetical protein
MNFKLDRFKMRLEDCRKSLEYAMTRSELLIGGTWRASREGSGQLKDVVSPFDGRTVGQVSIAGAADVEAALESASRGAEVWRRTPAHERSEILLKAAALADERTEQIAQVLSAENGKTLAKLAPKPAAPVRSSAWRRSKAHSSTARRCPSMRTRAPVWTRSDSRCPSRSAWSWPSPPSTTRRCWSTTRSPRRWPPATPSSSNPQAPPR